MGDNLVLKFLMLTSIHRCWQKFHLSHPFVVSSRRCPQLLSIASIWMLGKWLSICRWQALISHIWALFYIELPCEKECPFYPVVILLNCSATDFSKLGWDMYNRISLVALFGGLCRLQFTCSRLPPYWVSLLSGIILDTKDINTGCKLPSAERKRTYVPGYGTG